MSLIDLPEHLRAKVDTNTSRFLMVCRSVRRNIQRDLWVLFYADCRHNSEKESMRRALQRVEPRANQVGVIMLSMNLHLQNITGLTIPSILVARFANSANRSRSLTGGANSIGPSYVLTGKPLARTWMAIPSPRNSGTLSQQIILYLWALRSRLLMETPSL